MQLQESANCSQEKKCLKALAHYMKWDSGYSKQQSTRPQTLGYALTDSPAGQCAWIAEKMFAWTDCHGNPENALTKDEMLDNISVYWFTGTATSSARLYWESFGSGSKDPVRVPVGVSLYPKEILPMSRRWAQRRYPDLRYWSEPTKGGHFAAWEQPELFVQEIRAAFDVLYPKRPASSARSKL